MVKYKTEAYTKYHAWTSYTQLSAEAAKAIQDSCYDEIPTEIEVEIEGNHSLVIFYDAWGDFTPVNEAYENPGKVWSHSKKSDWYTHIATGIKVKMEVVKSPNYDKPNGNGSCTTTLTVKIPTPSERGKNPNSHNNRAIPGLLSKDINLTEEQWQTVEKMGSGKGYSQGVRNLLGQLG
jgi:hypothetical protein